MELKFIKNILFGVVLLAGGVLVSCSDDELNSIDMMVYLRPGGLEYVESVYTPTPIGLLGGTALSMPVQVTRNLAADATVSLVVNDGLVEAYNNKYGTSYNIMPSSLYSLSNNGVVSLRKGESVSSDSVKLLFTDPDKLVEMAEQGDFLLPVQITHISSSDNGLHVSSNSNTAYFILKFNDLLNLSVVDKVEGQSINRINWAVSSTNTFNPFIAENAIDNDVTTAWLTVSDRNPFIIDMNEENTVKGIHLISDYLLYGFYQMSITRLVVATSNDGVEYTNQGETGIDALGEGAYMKFYKPVTCRYVRITPLDYYACINEINLIK